MAIFKVSAKSVSAARCNARRFFVATLLVVMSLTSAFGQTAEKKSAVSKVDHFYDPLPQETGANGLKLVLRRLQTTGRLMQTTAHPDDEDGGMLTLEARGKGIDTLLMTLNRGEGGQNKLGSNLFDALGVLRTLELLAADRYYGVDQRFSRVADFGYSKNADETFQKWKGHDIALGDMVRVIRTFRPDVLVARFSGTDRDGHGHHQASAILTREAFRAAADPNRFPEQIKEGIEPWQPKKLYIGNVCGFGAMTCDAATYTLKLNTGTIDPLLGTSYIEFAMSGLRHQQSQGAANWTVDPGDRFTFYKLVDSVVESPKDKDGHEADFFDGINPTLTGLVDRLGGEEKKVPRLRQSLADVQSKIKEASDAAEKNAASAQTPLLQARGMITATLNQIAKSELPAQVKYDFKIRLQDVSNQIERAQSLAAGLTLHAVADAAIGIGPDDAFMAVPGHSFEVTARLSAAVKPNGKVNLALEVPSGWKSTLVSSKSEANDLVAKFKVNVPPQAAATRPYWHRNDPETEPINTIDKDKEQYAGLPLPPPEVRVVARTGEGSELLTATCMVKFKDALGVVSERPLAVAPAFSVMLDPGEQVIATQDGPQPNVKVDVFSNLSPASSPETASAKSAESEGDLRVAVPENWRAEPSDKQLAFHERGEKQSFDYKVIPGNRIEGKKEILASFKSGETSYREGFSVVTREDLGTFYYYQPATQHVSVIDVRVPKDFKVGYVMGAGDTIPTVLQQIGMDVTLIPAEHLNAEDLSKYQTIVLGIRAYDTQKDVVANNKRLLDFVQAGGRLVVQYNTSPADFNKGNFTPYTATLSRARVSVEDAPIAMLEPANAIFHSPNEISKKDFDGWVQERGLYFMSQWDSKFSPLLESHDPGESEQKGGLLIANYGKGTYVYTGYAFFRQVPAGVPGAVRLFVNLIASR